MLRPLARQRAIALTRLFAVFTAFGAATAATAAAGRLPLTEAVSRLLPPAQFTHLRLDLAKHCPEVRIDTDTPVSLILTPAFWAACLEGAGPDRPARDFSPLFRAPARSAETNLRAALAPHGLTLNMSESEVTSYLAGRPAADLKPLSHLRFTGPGGRPTRPAHLAKCGLFVIRDFNRAFAAELTLPEVFRFIDGYKRREDAVLKMKAVIDHELARGCVPEFGEP